MSSSMDGCDDQLKKMQTDNLVVSGALSQWTLHKDDYDVLRQVILAAGRGYTKDQMWRYMYKMLHPNPDCFGIVDQNPNINDEFRVVKILLYEFDSESICRTLKLLRTLKGLRFEDCQDVPTDIGRLDNLTELQLPCGRFSHLPPSIGQLKNLKKLCLRLTEKLLALPHEIGNLTNLEDLDLRHSAIKSFPPSIGNLPNLRQLDLWGTKNLFGCNLLGLFRLNLLPSYGFLRNLKHLILTCTNVLTVPDEISLLTNLQSLTLNWTEIAELPRTIGRLQNLEVLRLWNTNIESIPDEIGNLKNLKELDLAYSKLKSLPHSIGRLQHLTQLDLRSIRDLQELPEEIGNLRSLRRLNLDRSGVSGLPPSAERNLSFIVARRRACRECLWKSNSDMPTYDRFRIKTESPFQDQSLRVPPKIFPHVASKASLPFTFEVCYEESVTKYCIEDYKIPEHDAIYLLLRWARESFVHLLVNVRQLSDQDRSDPSLFRYERRLWLKDK